MSKLQDVHTDASHTIQTLHVSACNGSSELVVTNGYSSVVLSTSEFNLDMEVSNTYVYTTAFVVETTSPQSLCGPRAKMCTCSYLFILHISNVSITINDHDLIACRDLLLIQGPYL